MGPLHRKKNTHKYLLMSFLHFLQRSPGQIPCKKPSVNSLFYKRVLPNTGIQANVQEAFKHAALFEHTPAPPTCKTNPSRPHPGPS